MGIFSRARLPTQNTWLKIFKFSRNLFTKKWGKSEIKSHDFKVFGRNLVTQWKSEVSYTQSMIRNHRLGFIMLFYLTIYFTLHFFREIFKRKNQLMNRSMFWICIWLVDGAEEKKVNEYLLIVSDDFINEICWSKVSNFCEKKALMHFKVVWICACLLNRQDTTIIECFFPIDFQELFHRRNLVIQFKSNGQNIWKTDKAWLFMGCILFLIWRHAQDCFSWKGFPHLWFKEFRPGLGRDRVGYFKEVLKHTIQNKRQGQKMKHNQSWDEWCLIRIVYPLSFSGAL